MIDVAAADLSRESDAVALVTLLDAYARDPMGGERPLPAAVRERLVPDLQERIANGTALVMIARRAGEPLGVAVCFLGYSTFAARPLLNLHDLAVVEKARGAGVGRALLAAVETAARARGCVKLTLEVREDNARARRLYRHVGFADYTTGDTQTRTLFLERKL
ncbi:MAG TPA: GNAT family N-acetyltransferase [Myxococcota bacterium]|nr:GNAT family N-acetyltransferase [Myxococcota bacterium]